MPSRSKVEALRSFASKVRSASHEIYKHASQTPHFSVFTFHFSLLTFKIVDPGSRTLGITIYHGAYLPYNATVSLSLWGLCLTICVPP